MDTAEWKAVPRHYANERTQCRVQQVHSTNDHPFLPQDKKAPSKSSIESAPTSTAVVDDPLSMGTTRVAVMDDPLMMMMSSNVPAGSDPLSLPSNSTRSNPPPAPIIKQEKKEETEKQLATKYRAPWDAHKKQMLLEFTVSGNIKVGASFMKDAEFDESGGSAGKTVDRAKHRLQQLEADRGTVVQDNTEMSQNEYTSKIEELHSSLHRFWANDEKVATLKLAIKSSKMLGDTKFPQFYPSMFVMLSEILDSFGELVFQRIFSKANEVLPKQNHLKMNFTSTEVPDDAKETCRNWFYKTACIRDVLPRLYIEISLLRCYRFLNENDYPKLLGRLASLIRGVGDPLVALYLRCYLLRVGDRIQQELNGYNRNRLTSSSEKDDSAEAGNCIQPEQKTYVMTMVIDYLFSFQEFESEKTQRLYKDTGVSYDEYLHLHEPGINWLIRYIGEGASTETFTNILHKYNSHCKSSMVLKIILDSFKGKHYHEKAVAMIALIKQSSQNGQTKLVHLFESIGKQFVSFPPPQEQRLNVLNEVWKEVSRCDDLEIYVSCAVVWLDILLKHYGSNEVLILLSDLTQHISVAQITAGGGGDAGREAAKLIDQVSRHIEHFVSSLITYSSNEYAANAALAEKKSFSDENAQAKKPIPPKPKKNAISNILTSESLHKLLDTFKSQRKVEICKQLLESVAKHQAPTSNPIFINTLFDMARTLHDSIDAMSAEGERKNITSLICSFIGKIDFKKDLEQQLNLFVECRAAFPNLDDVQRRLVICVNGLAMKAHRFMHGKHTKKTSSFVKACLSYCHVTIPSVSDIFKRIELMLLSGEVALVNQCLPQTDTFLKATISLLPDVPPFEEIDYKKIPTERRLLPLIQKFISLLVMVPGHPQHGPFYLLQGLINALPRYPWQEATGLKTQAFISMIPLLSAHEQKTLPYTIARVESNDSLYGGSSDYMTALKEMRTNIINEILTQLSTLKELGVSKNNDKTIAIVVTQLSLDMISQLIIGLQSHEKLDMFLVKMCDLASKGKPLLSGSAKHYYDRTLVQVCKYAAEAAASGSKPASDLVIKASPELRSAAV